MRRAGTALAIRLRRAASELGPGLVTGAADDDPSGISTYATAGAAFGFRTLWTLPFSFPLVASVQVMCARLALITGRGLTGVLREHYPRWTLWTTCALLLVANTVTIAADLGGMGSAFELVTGIRSVWFHCAAAVLIVGLLAWTSYRTMARVFKWLTPTLLAYVGAAWLSHPAWGAVLRATIVPSLSWERGYLTTLVAIFGTTISPYLFVWQASQEVEETRSHTRGAASVRGGSRAANLAASRRDVLAGMFFSNSIAFFIMLTTGPTLFPEGAREVSSAASAAAALRPLAGDAASRLRFCSRRV